MRTTEKKGVQILIERCVANGVRTIVCSPGSRNAPIVLSAEAHPAIETIVIHDERVAAFFALGIAEKTNAPVAVTCTSGSAMLNYYPAVAEAYYRGIPLVVISADRPVEWVDHGDGQTIVQKGVYQNHIRAEFVVSEQPEDEDVHRKEIDQVFEKSLYGWKGPVHFNVPLSEPLYNTVEVDSGFAEKSPAPLTSFEPGSFDEEDFKTAWNGSKKRMILCGQMQKNPALMQALTEFAEDNSVAILTENTSNLASRRWVNCIDRTLAGIREEELEDFHPDFLITIGGAVISKRIKSFLRNADIQHHWKIGFDFPQMDTYRKLTCSVALEATAFVKRLLKMDLTQHVSNFGALWKQMDYIVQDRLSGFFADVGYGDLSVFEMLLDYIPENAFVHMSNSSVVRYCQLFDPIASFQYFANRGTSGIDGSTSTASGIAFASPVKLNVLLTGDISFFYDSNALWNQTLPSNLRIILMNNSGGGIFRIIEGPSGTGCLEKYFEAKHTTSAVHLCKAYHVHYLKAGSLIEIEQQMPFFYEESDRPKLLEIFTPNEVNHQFLKDFFDRAKEGS